MKPRYKLLKNIWKMVRTTLLAAVSFLLGNMQDWFPPELSSVVILALSEFFRNRLFGEHSARLLK